MQISKISANSQVSKLNNKAQNRSYNTSIPYDSVSFTQSENKKTKKHPAAAKLLAFVTAISASMSPYAKNTVYADDNRIAVTTVANENTALVPDYVNNPDYQHHLNHKFDLKEALLEQGITMNKDGSINTDAYIDTIGVPEDAQRIIDAHNEKVSKSEVRTSEMVIIENKIYKLDSKIKAAKSNIKKVNSEISKNEKLYNKANKKTKVARADYSKALSAVKKKNAKIKAVKKQKAIIENDLELGISKKSKRQNLINQKAELEKKIQKLNQSKKELVKKKNELKTIYNSKKKVSNSYLNKIHAQEAIVKGLQADKLKYENQIAQLQKKLDKLDSNLHPHILIQNY